MNIAQTLLLHDDEIAGFDQSPLEISIDVRMDWPVSGFTSARVDTGYGSRITRQLRCLIKSLDVSDLQRNDRC
jgi:hypothetical protein